jgi:hypothetical protein
VLEATENRKIATVSDAEVDDSFLPFPRRTARQAEAESYAGLLHQ